MALEFIRDGSRQTQIIREGELLLVPALVAHSPHRPADTWGLVVEVKRRPDQVESLLWFCDRCDALLHEVTMRVADIEGEPSRPSTPASSGARAARAGTFGRNARPSPSARSTMPASSTSEVA